MKRIMISILLLAACLSGETIKRDRTALRKGPGAWFPMVVELSQGSQVDVLQSGESWLKVRSGSEAGYIAAKALQGKTEVVTDVFAQMSGQAASTQASHAAVTAAVKGFAERFSKRLGNTGASITDYSTQAMDLAGYPEFRAATIDDKQLRKLNRKLRLPKMGKDRVYTFAEEGTGLAIAQKLGSMGLVDDPSLLKYVNHVGTFVAEQSEGYDIPFRFFILDQDGVNGYACPGGIVFITRGALEGMQNEAELACFLGHEIAHVVHRHGLKEMEERKEMIVSGNVFDEMALENEVSTEIGEASLDLDDFALDSYETIFQGRLGKYESSADELGLLYAARSGYDPAALGDFLKRIGSSTAVSNSEHYSKSQNMERQLHLNSYVQDDLKVKSSPLNKHEKRFRDALNK